MYGLQLELKIPRVFGELAGQDNARDKQQQRRHQHKAADDQSREARHKPGLEIFAQHRHHKADAYIEVFDRIDKPTMTGKMVYPIVDKFVVQWEEQKKVYPKAVNLGSIF